MAATLTGSGELLYASFPIDKVETDADGDLIVFGKASDGSVDSDQQVVQPAWMARAGQLWKESGANLRVMHNAQRDPAGVGLEVETDSSGATWVKGLVVEPIAKKLVAKGALRAYSVGIARPTIERDPTGKARGGIITGGELVEISLVDRPANKQCGIQLVKAADDGTPEYVGKVFGADDAIAKALGADVTKGGADTWTETPADMSRFGFPEDLSVNITPDDIMRVMQGKFVSKHYDELAAKAVAEAENSLLGKDHREFSAEERRHQAAQGNSLPDGSYPIPDKDALRRAAILARSGHGNVAAARRLIARRARELGVANPLDESDGATKSSSDEEALKGMLRAAGQFATAVDQAQDQARAQKAVDDFAAALKEADPDVTKDPEPEPKDRPVKKAKKPPKGKKKLPPWLNKPSDDDDGKDGDGDSGACKSVTDHLWTGVEGTSDIVCSKCHTTPAEAAGLSGTHDMSAAPVGELQETPPPMSAKASPTPQSASGAGEAPSMTPVPQHREPDGAIVEPFEKDAGLPATGQGEKPTRLEAGMMKSSPEVAAILRFRAAGIDAELGRAHDLTCPAYHPEDVAKCHPFADFRSVLDEGYFQRKAVEAACGPSLDRAKSLHLAWQAAHVLRETDPGVLNDFRLAAHKAFRDANPGPSSAPTPGTITPGKYNRPLITDGHEAASTGHDGPNSSPQVATTAPNAHSFARPPLESGHQSPSPSFMKASFEYPTEQGRPVQLNYAVMEKERARHALMQMHEHLSRQFPEVCPMDLDAPPVQPESRGVPSTAGIGKSGSEEEGPALAAKSTAAAPPVAAVLKAPAEDDLVDDAVYKGFKKMRKKLGKKVLSGDMTVDEARARMGRRFAQKAAEAPAAVPATYVPADPGMTPAAIKALQDSLNKMADDAKWHQKIIVLPPGTKAEAASPVAASLDPDLIKAAVKEALHVETVPLEAATIEAFDPSPAIEAAVVKATSELKELLVKQQETFTAKLAEQQRVIDAIADQPDPSTAAFSGLAFNPVRKAARPAGVPTQAEIAERSQQMMIRHLNDTYNSASDPFEREAARATLTRLRGGDA